VTDVYSISVFISYFLNLLGIIFIKVVKKLLLWYYNYAGIVLLLTMNDSKSLSVLCVLVGWRCQGAVTAVWCWRSWRSRTEKL